MPYKTLVLSPGRYDVGWANSIGFPDFGDHEINSATGSETASSLAKTGQLEENLRVKVHHFYPQTE